MSWEKFGTVYEAFQVSAQAAPEAPFLRIVADAARRYAIEPGSLSYGAALREVERLAAIYRTANLGRGCRVALLLGNRPEFFLHWLALNAVGVSVVPLNPDWGAAEVQYVLEHSHAVLAVAEATRREELDDSAKHLPRPPTVVDLTMTRLADFASRSGGNSSRRTHNPADEPLPQDEVRAWRNQEKSSLAKRGGNAVLRPRLAPQDSSLSVTGATHEVALSHGPGPALKDFGFGGPAQRLAAETECALLYTSGTTGRPKGCVLPNEYFLCCGEWYRRIGGLCELHPGRDCLITPLPMHHMNAMACSTMAMIMTGGCIAPLDRFHPSTWWASVREAEATIIHYLGVMPAMLLERDQDPLDARHKVRFGFGAGVSAAHHTAFEQRFGFPLVEAWAMTETGCAAAIIANEAPRKVGTACFGRPPQEVEWRIVDDRGEDCALGATGELLVRRAGKQPRFGFFREYLHDRRATDAAWQGGFFHTGDLVCQDDEGLLHFVDRKKNLIRRSGENIAAVEVEAVIAEHPQVGAVGVAGVPDRIRGDEVMALVVPKPTPNPDADSEENLARAIVAHCRRRLAYYKAPGYVAFCKRLPLTATEKVQRAGLKALAQARLAAGSCLDTRDLKRRQG